MFFVTTQGQGFQSAPHVFKSDNECQMALAVSKKQLEDQFAKAKVDGVTYEFKCIEWK